MKSPRSTNARARRALRRTIQAPAAAASSSTAIASSPRLAANNASARSRSSPVSWPPAPVATALRVAASRASRSAGSRLPIRIRISLAPAASPRAADARRASTAIASPRHRALRRGDRRGLQQRVLVVWLDLQDLPVERPSRLQQPVLHQVIGDAHVLFDGFVGLVGAVVAVAERVGRRPVVRETPQAHAGTRRWRRRAAPAAGAFPPA